MDLSGTWRGARSTDERRRDLGRDSGDDGWVDLEVPGHWRDHPDFASESGPLLYRRSFRLDSLPSDHRRFLVFDGIFYQADVWMDGAYLGDAEGYFAPHSFDITALSGLATDHVVAVEVDAATPRDLTAKRSITGVLHHWDCLDPDDSPAGLWRGARIETTGPVRIDRWRVLCRDANERRAHLRLHGRFDSDASRQVRIVTRVDGIVVAETDRLLATGLNEVDWTVDVDSPRLWWPWSLGTAELYTVECEVLVDSTVSHTRSVRTGMRQVRLNDWVLSVNGERLFLKGANLGPSHARLGTLRAEDLHRDVALAREAGLDLIRLHAHITRPELYDAADETGMLLWQDFPLQWGYARSVRHQAVAQVREAVDLLGHHPSIAMWCGHNEPIALDTAPGQRPSTGRLVTRFLMGQQLPTWNRTVLDRWVKRAFERADGTRAIIAHSGVLPHFPQLDGTDSHLYFGWYHGQERDLPGAAAATPRLMRFVSEFGAQAVPDTAEFMEPERWPDLDWDRLERHHALQLDRLDTYVPRRGHATFDSWRRATQDYQATVLRHHIETLRRLKYRPTGGFCLFMLADAIPAVSWSILDHERVPKLAYHSVLEACRPVIPIADRLPRNPTPGTRLRPSIHVVNDLHRDLGIVTLTARFAVNGQHYDSSFEGEIPADSCVKVATLDWTIPATARGNLELALELNLDSHVVTSSQIAAIAI